MVTSRRKKTEKEVQFSCANCKHRFLLPSSEKRPMEKDIAECRRFPMVFVPVVESEDGGMWVSPPAPSDFLCGEHVLKYNS
jgi:hypothetical protein